MIAVRDDARHLSLLPRFRPLRANPVPGHGLGDEYYFLLNPKAGVTEVDLSEGMLRALASKFPDKEITLVRGSYFFDVEFGTQVYDAAVSVESLR